MSVDNLPAVLRTSAALAVVEQRPTAEPATPAPLRLSTGLLIVSVIAAALALVSLAADRAGQAALVSVAALGLLVAAGTERWREHRT